MTIHCDCCDAEIREDEDYYEIDGEVLCHGCAIDKTFDSDDFRDYCEVNDVDDDFLLLHKHTNNAEDI